MGVIVGGLEKPTFRARAMDAATEVWQNTDERVGFGVLVAGDFFPTNDWRVNPHGEVYRRTVERARAGDILRRLEDDLGPSRRAIDEAFARRYGWDEPARVAALYRATPAADDVTLLHAGLPFGARMVGMGVGYVPRYAVDQDATFKEPLIAGASRCPWLLAP